jgi:hypothetical protein
VHFPFHSFSFLYLSFLPSFPFLSHPYHFLPSHSFSTIIFSSFSIPYVSFCTYSLPSYSDLCTGHY